MTLLHVAPEIAGLARAEAVLVGWQWRTAVVGAVAAASAGYVVGWVRLRRSGGIGGTGLAAHFAALVAIVAALLSPIDGLADRLLTFHMIQHALLMMVAPPLLLLANPFPVGLWAFPRPLRLGFGRLLSGGARLRRLLRAATAMPVAWAVSMAILWGWHLPVLYDAALQSRLVHDLEHLSFFGAGLLFWWPLVDPAPRVRGRVGYGFRLAYVVASVASGMLPCIVLGLFARRVFYEHYLTVSRPWGLTALDDQAMAWGLMAVVNGLVYALAFFTLVARLAAHEERETGLEAFGVVGSASPPGPDDR